MKLKRWGDFSRQESGAAQEALRGELEVGDAEDRTLRLVGEAFDLPAVREHDLLDNGQAQTGALLLGCEVRLEDFGAVVRGNPGAIVADFEHGFGGIALFGDRSEEHTSELQSPMYLV